MGMHRNAGWQDKALGMSAFLYTWPVITFAFSCSQYNTQVPEPPVNMGDSDTYRTLYGLSFFTAFGWSMDSPSRSQRNSHSEIRRTFSCNRSHWNRHFIYPQGCFAHLAVGIPRPGRGAGRGAADRTLSSGGCSFLGGGRQKGGGELVLSGSKGPAASVWYLHQECVCKVTA